MSYTAPDNIQTKADAIIALASTIADSDLSARGDGTVNTALDVLADQLADSDVDVPPTNAGAILELAKYVSQGGGGGASYPIVLGQHATAYLATLDESGNWVPDMEHAISEAAVGTCVYVTTEAGYEAWVTASYDNTAEAEIPYALKSEDGVTHIYFIMPDRAVIVHTDEE